MSTLKKMANKFNLGLLISSLLVGSYLLGITPAWAQEVIRSNCVPTKIGTTDAPNPCAQLLGGTPFVPLPGCIAARTVVPLLNEKDYPGPGTTAATPATCGPTSAAMILQSLGITTSIAQVTTEWSNTHPPAWTVSTGFYATQIPGAVNGAYPGQVRTEYHAIKNAQQAASYIQQTGNAVAVSAYYNNSGAQAADKQQTSGAAGQTQGAISPNGIPHMLVVYQVCPDRVYIADPVYGEQYSVPASFFSTVVSTGDRGEGITFESLQGPAQGTLATPANGKVTLCYGATTTPYSPGHPHKGIDIGNNIGTTIYAAEVGVVTAAGSASDMGNYVQIKHPSGISTVYMHLLEGSIQVHVNQQVGRREPIGQMDTTGTATGSHLHFAVKNAVGEYVDPAPFLGLQCSEGLNIDL